MRSVLTPLVVVLCLCSALSTLSQTREIKVGIINGRAKYLPKPELSNEEQDSCASGQVKVEVLVDVEGKVIAAKAISGNAHLHRASVRAAKEARFSPTLIEGPPINVRGYFVYNFPTREECASRNQRSVAITCGDCGRKVISLPKPEFPRAGTYLGLSGPVAVQILIGEKGNVLSAKAVSGHPLLRPSAVKAALSARFEPYTLSGKPVRVYHTIVYNFVRE